MNENMSLILKAIQDRMEEFKNDPVISQHYIDLVIKEGKSVDEVRKIAVQMAIATLCLSPEKRKEMQESK